MTFRDFALLVLVCLIWAALGVLAIRNRAQ